MAEIRALPTRRDFFTDARGDGRRMQVTCHPDTGLSVLSMWHGPNCVASFQLPNAEAGRLIGLLAQGLSDVATTTGVRLDSETG